MKFAAKVLGPWALGAAALLLTFTKLRWPAVLILEGFWAGSICLLVWTDPLRRRN